MKDARLKIMNRNPKDARYKAGDIKVHRVLYTSKKLMYDWVTFRFLGPSWPARKMPGNASRSSKQSRAEQSLKRISVIKYTGCTCSRLQGGGALIMILGIKVCRSLLRNKHNILNDTKRVCSYFVLRGPEKNWLEWLELFAVLIVS